MFEPNSIQSNEPVEDASKRTEQYNPTPEETKTIKLVTKLYQKSKKARSRYDSNWVRYYQMFRGKQWHDQRPSYRSSEVINLVWQTIQSFVPILTDTRPRFEYAPGEPTDIPACEIINEVAQWDWDRKNWAQIVTELLYDGHFYGTGLTQLDFHAQGDNGMGAITLETLEPLYCYPDHNAPTINHPHSKYFITAIPMDIDLLKTMYPSKAKYLQPDTSSTNLLDKYVEKDLIYKSPSDNIIITNESPENYSNSEKTILYTMFYRDEEYDEEELQRPNPQSGQDETVYTQKLKYPKGRLIQIASNVVLKDDEIPVDDRFFPVQKYINYVDPRSPWGVSEIEQLEAPQKMFNKTLSYALDVMNLMGNPIWIVDTTAEIDTENLVNKAGLVVEKNPGTEVRREAGVPLQPFVMELLQNFRAWHDAVSGSQDVSRGINPVGVTAASAISELQQASQTRIRLKSRNLDAYLQDLGQQYLSYMFQFYTIPRIVRLTNKNNEKLSEFFRFHIDSIEGTNGETQKVFRIRRYHETESGHALGEEEIYSINGKFDVKVMTGSSLPFSKMENETRLLKLYDRKLIDNEEVLKGLDFPNYEEVLERMNERQMAEQQMMQQQEQQPKGKQQPLPPQQQQQE